MDVTVEFKLPARIKKRGRWFISSCPVLDVHSQGETRQRAEENLIDALTSFLVSCYERGTLEEVLREAGFTPSKSRKGRTSRSASHESVVVSLPFMIERRSGRVASSA